MCWRPKERLQKAYINTKFIETCVLEIDPGGYIKHIRKVITLIHILVYVLKADPKRGCIWHI